MIRERVELHGTARDGRLFQTAHGGIYLPSTLSRAAESPHEGVHRGAAGFAADAQAV